MARCTDPLESPETVIDFVKKSLERLGWRLHRIWGPAWYRSRTEQEARLRVQSRRLSRSGSTCRPTAGGPDREWGQHSD